MGRAQAPLRRLAGPPAVPRSPGNPPRAGDPLAAGQHRGGPRACESSSARCSTPTTSHRQTYRHLARFERKFDKYGLRTIEQLPVDQLRRALREFESLVRNWSSPSLADLRSRMAVVLADRSSASSVWIAANSVNGAQRHGPGIAMQLPAGSGPAATRAAVQRGGRHVGMSRFNWADGGFNSTSAPA